MHAFAGRSKIEDIGRQDPHIRSIDDRHRSNDARSYSSTHPSILPSPMLHATPGSPTRPCQWCSTPPPTARRHRLFKIWASRCAVSTALSEDSSSAPRARQFDPVDRSDRIIDPAPSNLDRWLSGLGKHRGHRHRSRVTPSHYWYPPIKSPGRPAVVRPTAMSDEGNIVDIRLKGT